jgi:hypothetical protein
MSEKTTSEQSDTEDTTSAPKRGCLKNGLIILTSVVFTIIMIEFGLQALSAFPLSPTLTDYNPVTITSLSPNVYARHLLPGEYNVFYKTNSLGLRNEEIAIDKPEGICRILGVGDSFTMGWDVDDAETYLHVLQSELQTHYDVPIEVINTASAGWGTSQELIYLETQGRNFSPDLITVGMYENDRRENLQSQLVLLDEDGNLVRYPVQPYEEVVPLERRLITKCRSRTFWQIARLFLI